MRAVEQGFGPYGDPGPYTARSEVEIGLRDGTRLGVRVAEAGGGHAPATQDSWFVGAVAGRVRVAVLDGVTPTASTRPSGSVDGAAWACGVARAHLAASPSSLDDVCREINAVLHDPSVSSSRDQRQVALVAADLWVARDGHLSAHVVRAADCMAWTRVGAEWRELFEPEARVDAVAAAVGAWLRVHGPSDEESRFAFEEAVSGSPEHWHASALGRFAVPRLQSVRVGPLEELVLASDGAQVDDQQPAAAAATATFSPVDATALHCRVLSAGTPAAQATSADG